MPHPSQNVAERLPLTITAESVNAFAEMLDVDVRWGSDETSDAICESRAQVEGLLWGALVPLAPVSLVLFAVRPRALLVGWYSERGDLGPDEPANGLLVLTVSEAATITDIRVPDSLADAYGRLNGPGTAYVDVLSVRDCPHVGAAIAAVRSAAAAESLSLEVDVRIIDTVAAAELAQYPGSPLVRVNGITAGPAAALNTFGAGCLLPNQLPVEADIRDALRLSR